MHSSDHSLEPGSAARTLYVTHVAPDTSEKDLKALFETYGVVEHCRLCTQSKHSAGLLYGFVRFSTVEEANEAIQNLNGYQLNKWRLEVKFEGSSRNDKPQNAKPADHQRSAPKQEQPQEPAQPREAVYVKGIPKTWGADEMKSLFGLAGEVVSCHMLAAKNTTIETCSAIVKMATVDAATKAIEFLDNKKPPGSAYLLGVKYAEAQDDSTKRKDGREKPVRSNNQRYAPYNPSERPSRVNSNTAQNEYDQQTHQTGVTQQNIAGAMAGASALQLQNSLLQQSLFGQNPMLPQLGNQFGVMPFTNSGMAGNSLAMQAGMPYGMSGDQAVALQAGFGMPFGAGGQDATGFQNMQNIQNMQNMQNMQLAQPFNLANQAQQGFAQPKLGGEGPSSANANNGHQDLTSIYISGLPFEVDDLFLYKHFAPYGGVLNVKILTDKRTGKPTGAGFVNYANQAAAEAAHAAMNKVKMNDRVELHVVLQAPRQRSK